jgi:hypothetical protein
MNHFPEYGGLSEKIASNGGRCLSWRGKSPIGNHKKSLVKPSTLNTEQIPHEPILV